MYKDKYNELVDKNLLLEDKIKESVKIATTTNELEPNLYTKRIEVLEWEL